MAITNKERVGRVLDAVRDGLAPYIVREFKMYHKKNYITQIDNSLTSGKHPGLPRDAWNDDAALAAALDAHACLSLITKNWPVFQDKLGHAGRNYVGELLGLRNEWAHAKQTFSNDEAHRAADTAALLMKMIGAVDAAAAVEDHRRELRRLSFEAEAKSAVKTNGKSQSAEITTAPGLKPWREVVQPHRDVASGRYIQAEFAADLAQVIDRKAEPEYQDPVEFFRRTYLTEGLIEMLTTGVKRLTSQGGEPVVQLKTSFGGGKTHSMLALYHLSQGKVKLSDIPGGERLAQHIGNVDLPETRCAVLVGTALDPSKPRLYPDATVRTLWGELAYQLGGLEGYQIVEAADLKGVSPGSNTLVDLLYKFGPCLIIIDELIAYARNVYGVDDLPSGSFESVMTFMQALTEAVKRSSDSLMLVSLPESNIEVGGDAGREALETLSHIVGRIESVWKPVTATESFEIVRRRLFASEIDYAARDAVIDAFGAMYRKGAGEFPSGVSEREYLDRMKSAYPIHPEMFDRLYQDWSTLERFQRTRGVLRLMAAVIHELWKHDDKSLIIMPGTIPLDASPVRNELLRYLPDTWTAVFDRDIDGHESLTLWQDGQVPALGRYNASRRVARTIFIGSAPSVTEQHVRGLEEVRIRLGCAQPGEPTAIFGDALRRMSSLLTYLYTDGSRYWYDTRPTVNRLARDRAQSFTEDEVMLELIERLRKVSKPRDFAAIHVCPQNTSDVADESRARLVVLAPGAAHKRGEVNSLAIQSVYALLESRGNAQRLYKNMLLFLAPDQGDMEALVEAVREHLAWHSIRSEEEQLNLDAQQRRQVMQSLTKANETVDLRLRSAYNWLLTPYQPDALGKIEIQATKISGEDNFYERSARKLRNDGLLISDWSPDLLKMELDKWPLWGDDGQVGLKQLWEYLAQYCYLPRLFDHEVLLKAVRDGAGRYDAPLAYATGLDTEGFHTGLVYQSSGSIYFDERSLAIRPDSICLRPVPEPQSPVEVDETPVRDDHGRNQGLSRPQQPRIVTRYYGRTTIDPQRVNKETGLIVEEIIERLTSLVGCNVEINLEIGAILPAGFDEATMRTINENSQTLKFDQHGFEE